MADDTEDAGTEGGASSDSLYEHFERSITEKYGADDEASIDREDGISRDEGDEEGITQDDGDDDSNTADHPKAGTSSKPDERDDESDDESRADADPEHPAKADSDDDDDDDDAGGEDDEDEDEIADETKGALEKHGAVLTLDEIPKEYQAPIKAKLRNIDAAFTRAQMEATAFRTKAREVEAEERFRKENPARYIAEVLLASPDLIESVQDLIDKTVDPDQKKLFEILTRDARKEAADKVTSEQTAYERALSRGQEVNDFAQSQAKALGLPWRLAERTVYSALLEKPEDKRDLTNAEVTALLKAEAAEYTKEQRAITRKASVDLVKDRTSSRRAAPPAGARTPGSAVSPRPAGTKLKVDHGSEESRQSALMNSMRRIAPGRK
jgi:hypothetical protein